MEKKALNRFFIKLQFNGTHYSGWQIQPNAPTIQQELIKALETLLKHPVDLVGAGRTDTGVHAREFYAHFDTPFSTTELEQKQILKSLNAMVGNDIFIEAIIPVPLSLHARFSAISRTYRYYITLQKDPFHQQFAFLWFGNPQLEAMNKACSYLFDYSDFTSFSKLHTQTATNNCKILTANWEQQENLLIFTIEADRFLRNMVRAITGTMLEIGRGRLKPEDICSIIEAKDRNRAGTSVPACGLFLEKIKYPEF